MGSVKFNRKYKLSPSQTKQRGRGEVCVLGFGGLTPLRKGEKGLDDKQGRGTGKRGK